MKRLALTHIPPNKKMRIVEINGGFGIKQRLMHMGMYVGRDITKLSHIGLEGPVVIKVGRTILALGHGVASKVFVESV